MACESRDYNVPNSLTNPLASWSIICFGRWHTMCNGAVQMRSWTRSAVGLGLVFWMTSCIGEIGPAAGDDDGPGPGPQNLCSDEAPLMVPLQRINIAQFEQVMTELFGEGLVLDQSFPVPLQGYPYSTFSAANPVADAQVKPIMETVEAIAMQVADRIPACSGDETACANTYLSELATRALRRSPEAAELAILMDLYSGSRAEMDYSESVAVGVFGLLQMPQFLYLFEEQPADTEAVTLDGQEIAQRMAMLYWNGLPDDELYGAAESGGLADAETRRAQAARMLADPRAKVVLAGFMREWMMVKGFVSDQHSPALAAALEEELRRNIDDALASEDGLTALLTSNQTYVNSELEAFYGLPAESAGPDDWRAALLDPAQRVGILTHPVLMSKFAHGDKASIILRGKFVRMNLLCTDINPPPQGAQEAQNELTPAGATAEEQSQARLDSEACGGCHTLMDPIGYGFAAFDGAGRWQSNVGADATAGNIFPPSELYGEFSGVRELGERLAQGEEVKACFARQWLRYSLGKKETVDEKCSMEAISAAMSAESNSLTEIFASAVAVEAFVTRASEVEQ